MTEHEAHEVNATELAKMVMTIINETNPDPDDKSCVAIHTGMSILGMVLSDCTDEGINKVMLDLKRGILAIRQIYKKKIEVEMNKMSGKEVADMLTSVLEGHRKEKD